MCLSSYILGLILFFSPKNIFGSLKSADYHLFSICCLTFWSLISSVEAIRKSSTQTAKILDSIREKGFIGPVTHVLHDRKPVGFRWVFINKADWRFKARPCAQCFSQVYDVDVDVDVDETYSPTLRADSLRKMLAVAAHRDLEIYQFDVKMAYLEGDLEEEIYMKAPEGFSDTRSVKIEKSMYGSKRSGRARYQKLDGN